MVLTLDKLFNDNLVLKAIINRVNQTETDRIYWQRYLDFEFTTSRYFKTYLGTVTGVTMGSIIDKNGNKPLRERRNLGTGIGEVAALGNKYQMDNDRLDTIQELVKKFNAAGQGQPQAMDDIINFIADDIRQCTLAPHKRMDYIVGQLRSTGKASVNVDNNKDGISLIDIELPVLEYKPTSSDKSNLVSYVKTTIDSLRPSVGVFSVMEMTRSTFNKRIAASSEFQAAYKAILSGAEMKVAGGLLSDTMANQMLSAAGLPNIRIIDEYVGKEDGTSVNTFAEDRITLLTKDKIGKMMYHTPYEVSDPIPGKVYTDLSGGHFISTQRTEEGRFTEYMAEWMPNITEPNKITIINLDDLN